MASAVEPHDRLRYILDGHRWSARAAGFASRTGLRSFGTVASTSAPASAPELRGLCPADRHFLRTGCLCRPAMEGVARGTVRTLRVIGLDYRAAGIGSNGNGGPGGGALISTPPSVGNGAWDPKILIGDAPVYADGSVFFTTEARTRSTLCCSTTKGAWCRRCEVGPRCNRARTPRAWAVTNPKTACRLPQRVRHARSPLVPVSWRRSLDRAAVSVS